MSDLPINDGQDKIWSYFQDQGIELFLGAQARLAYILKEIRKRNLHSVLNIGVGGGTFEQIAREEGLKVSSIDPDSAAIEQLGKRLEIDARVGYAQDIPFEDAQFDAVVVSEVLEHLEYETMLQVFTEVKRVLVPGGYFIGTVPYQEKLLNGMAICPYCGRKFHRWGHLQSFSTDKMCNFLTSYFDVEHIFPRLFITFSTLNWKGEIIASVKWILWKLGLSESKTNLVFIARRGKVS